MDDPNVNWLVLKLVNEHRKLNELAKVIPTGLYFYFSFRNKLETNSFQKILSWFSNLHFSSQLW